MGEQERRSGMKQGTQADPTASAPVDSGPLRCSVSYRRRYCEPFCLGIEGARCGLAAGHAGEHVVEIVKQFGDSPDEDMHEEFGFQVSGIKTGDGERE